LVQSARRNLVASASPITPSDRLDVLIHAVAQLSETVRAEIHGDGPERQQLDRLTHAYGLSSRIRITSSSPDRHAGFAVYPSRHNAATAPLRPGDSAVGSVILNDGPRSLGAERSRESSPTGGAAPPRVVDSMAGLLDAVSAPRDEPAPLLGDARKLRGHRVGIVTNYPTHYRVPLFNLLGKRLSEAGVPMRVFFTAADPRARTWMVPEPVQFEHEFLRGVRVTGSAGDMPLALESRLGKFAPTLLLTGGFSPLSSARVARFARRRGIPVGVWSGQIPTRREANSGLRRIQRRRLIRRLDYAIAYGFESGEYLRGLAPDLPCVYGRNTAPFPPRSDGRARRTVEILALSRAVAGKNLGVVIDAVRLLDLPCRLRIAGGGPELAVLERRIDGDERVELLGAVNSNRVGELYRDADIFMCPSSSDVFGLVLVEALAAGLAVVTSERPGAAGDLAVPGRNCLVPEGEGPSAWAATLRTLIEEEGLRRTLGEAAAATVRNRWTMQHAVGAMICGLALGADRAGRRA
jgi:glycosyltransferase involved in cell wall biosynthesis